MNDFLRVFRVAENELRASFLPKYFFVVKGSGVSDVSASNAFDAALTRSGIGQCNLVSASSILPKDAKEIPQVNIKPGAITFIVMAHADGVFGETIGAGIGLGWLTEENRVRYGIIAEAHGIKDEEDIEKELRRKIKEMAKIRKLGLKDIKTIIESIKVTKKYGSVVAVLVFLPSSFDKNLVKSD